MSDVVLKSFSCFRVLFFCFFCFCLCCAKQQPGAACAVVFPFRLLLAALVVCGCVVVRVPRLCCTALALFCCFVVAFVSATLFIYFIFPNQANSRIALPAVAAMPSCSGCRRSLSNATYSATKKVRLPLPALGLFHKVTQVVLGLYVLVYSILYKRGYQTFSPLTAVVTYSTGNNSAYLSEYCHTGVDWPNCGPYDYFDVVLPSIPIGSNQLFFTTAFEVASQERSKQQSKVPCASADDCIPSFNNTLTGNCTFDLCEEYAWTDKHFNSRVTHLPGVGNFTVQFRVQGIFGSFSSPEIFVSNDTEKFNLNTYFVSDLVAYSQHHPRGDTTSGTVLPLPVNSSGFETISSLEHGAEIYMLIKVGSKQSTSDNLVPCNLDPHFYDCVVTNATFSSTATEPTVYTFVDPGPSLLAVSQRDERSFVTAAGVLINLAVAGSGGKFDAITMLRNVGSGMGLLSLATVIADLILAYGCCHSRRYILSTVDRSWSVKPLREHLLQN